MRALLLALMALTFGGCTYHWQTDSPVTPVTYESTPHRQVDSIGKLRRLVLMPVEIDPYQGKYVCAKDQETAVQSYQDACVYYLAGKKGYEVVAVGEHDGQWRTGPSDTLSHDELQALHNNWHEAPAGKQTAPVIQQIGMAFEADGVLVVRIKEGKPWGVVEGILNIALMNIPLFYQIVSPDIAAWIYETASGRLVWREAYAVVDEQAQTTVSASTRIINLFADLENAVPRQLIK